MEKILFTTEMEYYNEGFDKNDDYNSIFELNDFYDCLLIGTIGLWNGTHKSCAYISEPKELMENGIQLISLIKIIKNFI